MAYAPFDLRGKVALVTGGNRGIGYGMAEALGQSGAQIAIWGSNEERNTEAAKRLRKQGIKAEAWTVDVSKEEQVQDSMTDVILKFGRIDTVIANAGIGGGAPSFETMPTSTLRKVFSVNLDGVFWTLREAVAHMVDRAKNGDAGGSLMVVSSLAAIEGAARNQAYAASKGAVISMTKSIAVEHAKHGITANAILPGWIATDMTSAMQGNDTFEEKVIKRVPMRRWGGPEDFGGMAVYLSSDAARYQTGTVNIIDGGYSIF